MTDTFRELKGQVDRAQKALDGAGFAAARAKRDEGVLWQAADVARSALNRFVPSTKKDLLDKLAYVRRQVAAIEGTTDEWPGLGQCVDLLRRAEKSIKGRGRKAPALLETVWEELRERFGDSNADTIAVASVTLGVHWVGARVAGATGEVLIT